MSKEEKKLNVETPTVQPDEMSLPENAFRELKDGEQYTPVLKPGKVYPEVTPGDSPT